MNHYKQTGWLELYLGSGEFMADEIIMSVELVRLLSLVGLAVIVV